MFLYYDKISGLLSYRIDVGGNIETLNLPETNSFYSLKTISQFK